MADVKNYVINKSSFEFAQLNSDIHDAKLETKPVGYIRDALRRFGKNKGSVVAACVILILLVYAIVAPIASNYTITFEDPYYVTTLPVTSTAFENQNIDFWDGCKNVELEETLFQMYYGINQESGQPAVKRSEYEKRVVTEIVKRVVATKKGRKVEDVEISTNYYNIRLNSYYQVGCIYMNFTAAEYKAVLDYQDQKGVQIFYPVVDKNARVTAVLQDYDASGGASMKFQHNDANFWYKFTVSDSNNPVAVLDENGKFINNYMQDATTISDNYTSRMLIEGSSKQYRYAIPNQTGYEVRVNYYEYFRYTHAKLGDGIDKPVFLFGTNGRGQDIFTCLAAGARFSFLLSLIVALINLTIGTLYGAIEGYYGGITDMIMERISDILGAIPLMIVLTLVRMQLGYHQKELGLQPENIAIISLIISFFATGWIGMAASVRMQFYRYKNQEYILAARTLGARDLRIMFRHIFPNAIGTLITGSILVVPGVIFSESSLSYLGILDLSTSTSTSVGVLLANGQPYLTSHPHIILFPALFIALLMLSFNLFGNGLRDAFNPSLRGSEG